MKKPFKDKNTRENSYIGMINALAYANEARDHYIHGHSERVARFAKWRANGPDSNERRLK